ncbi:MAG: alanyl-tRNA editing protein AlaXM [Nanoarchaeota archaeon]
MTQALYLDNCYLKEFPAKVVAVEGTKVELDQSAFYPNSGGQPGDFGMLQRGQESFKVLDTVKQSGRTLHLVDREGLQAGDEVRGEIDRERRFRLMRMHTAAHLFSGVINKETGADITGNQLGLDKSRIDFSLENFNREQLKAYDEKVNGLITAAMPVKIYELPREEAFQIPALVKLRMLLPEHIRMIRIIDIEGFDKQACGGTHVKNTGEIGKVQIIGAENKGKDNRRLYYTII